MGSLPSWDMDDQHSVAPSPEEFTWTKTLSTSQQSVWWMTNSEVSKACNELIKYTCNGDCTNCNCERANLDAHLRITVNITTL